MLVLRQLKKVLKTFEVGPHGKVAVLTELFSMFYYNIGQFHFRFPGFILPADFTLSVNKFYLFSVHHTYSSVNGCYTTITVDYEEIVNGQVKNNHVEIVGESTTVCN